MSENKTTVVAEAIQHVQILPVYPQWNLNRMQISPVSEHVDSSLQNSGPREVEKVLKSGVLGKKKGVVNVSVQIPDCFAVTVDDITTHSMSIPVVLRYSPIKGDSPPNITLLAARLHAKTDYNVDSRHYSAFSGTYNCSIIILRPYTPSPLTWIEDLSSDQLFFTSNLTIPLALPYLVGSSTTKGTKLLPSFESCLISRSYQIEIKLGFGGSNDIIYRAPIRILAKLGDEATFTSAMETIDEQAPFQGSIVGEVDFQMTRPRAANFDSGNNHGVTEVVNQGPGDEPPEYSEGGFTPNKVNAQVAPLAV